MKKAKSAHVLSKDPHHAAILAALEDHLDDQAFEACAADLLGRIYSNLVPMSGGSDDGYDGVIYDAGIKKGDGPPNPLISTTRKEKAKANLAHNLTRACRSEPRPMMAVFATPRRLTPRQRKTLVTWASNAHGVTLRIYEQDWFANTLYRDAAWTRKLLSLTGRPSALSSLPLSSRPLLDTPLIGRDGELEKLRHLVGDALIIAEPGAGKTFLLSTLARENRAHFLADPEPEALANAIRELKPQSIIVDDAHANPGCLTRLRHLRQEISAGFQIIGVGWPGAAAALQAELGVASDKVIDLPGIDRDTMVEIVHAVGVTGSRELVRSIVHQAEGRPGLATTLADLCLRGDTREVWTGQSLARDLLPALERLLGEDPVPLLGCFSLGGSAGMKTERVARFLGRPLDQVSTLLARLGSAGIIRENRRHETISVWPEVLRWILVRDVFFGRPGRLPFKALLNEAPELEQAVMSLVGAKARGAHVPDLETWLERCHTSDVWGAYASLGAAEAMFVIRSRPAFVVDLSWILLNACPDEVILLMLDAAIGDERPLHAHPGHPLRRLQTWIGYPFDRGRSRSERSAALVTVVEQWWRRRGFGDPVVGNIALQAFALAFEPNWQATESDPGRGRTLTLSFGSVTDQECDDLSRLWRERQGILSLGAHAAWKHLITMAREWMHAPPNVRLSNVLYARRHEIAGEIIRNLSAITQDHRGAQHQLEALAVRLDIRLETLPPSDFDILFPARQDPTRYRDEFETWSHKARTLAPAWLSDGPAVSARRAVEMEREAREADITWPRQTHMLFDEIARQSDTPALWAAALLDVRAPADLLRPFVRRLAERSDERADTILRQCLDDPDYGHVGLEAALMLPSTAQPTVDLAIERAENCADLVRTLALREQLSQERLQHVMMTGSPVVALAAALGDWHVAKQAKRFVHAPEIWRAAILHSADLSDVDQGKSFELGEIFKSDPALAAQWLKQLCRRSDEHLSYDLGKIADLAAAQLTPADRLALVTGLDAPAFLEQLAHGLVANDTDAYRALLGREDLSACHLAPLAEDVSVAWRRKAIVALDAGYTPEQVRRATHPHVRSWSGNESDMWKERKSEVDQFLNDADPRIAALIREMSERLERTIAQCLEDEHQKAVRGSRR